MIFNNGSMTSKRTYLSFINKGFAALYIIISMIIIVPCVFFMFSYWNDMPATIKVVGPSISVIVFLAVFLVPFQGMWITKKGTIVFVPDFRIIRTHWQELERLSLTFREWENDRYSAAVKLVYKDGRTFTKEYAKAFASTKHKKQNLCITPKKREIPFLNLFLLQMTNVRVIIT